MLLRKLFSTLRKTSTLIAIAAVLSLGYEAVTVPTHHLGHAVQAAHLQTESSSAQLATDGCDLCRAFSFLVSSETFFPTLVIDATNFVLESVAVGTPLAASRCVLPPSRAPPVYAA